MSTDLTLSKAEISKINLEGLGSLLSKLAAPLGITAATLAIDAGIQKNIHASGRPLSTTLIILNKK